MNIKELNKVLECISENLIEIEDRTHLVSKQVKENCGKVIKSLL